MTLGRFVSSVVSFHMILKGSFVLGSVVTHAADMYVCLIMSFYMVNYVRIDNCLKSTVGAFAFVDSCIFKIKTRI